MFRDASSFNGAVNVSNITDMYMAFKGSAFNQDVRNWNVSNVTDLTDVFSDTNLTTFTYDAILNGWSQRTLKQGVPFGVGTTRYSPSGTSARAVLTNTYN